MVVVALFRANVGVVVTLFRTNVGVVLTLFETNIDSILTLFGMNRGLVGWYCLDGKYALTLQRGWVGMIMRLGWHDYGVRLA